MSSIHTLTSIQANLTKSPVSFRVDRAHDESIQHLLALIDAHERFLVVGHIHPDGDATGSTLAMGLLLEEMGKQVTFYNRDPIPAHLRFLPAASKWVTALHEGARFDVTIILDCAQLHRIGEELIACGALSERVAVIDHHSTWDDDFAHVYVRDTSAAATGEVIFRVLVAAGLELSLDLARCLYCCILTDTGSFRYSSTSKLSFQIAGELIEAGVSPWEMTSRIYESQPAERVELLGHVLTTLTRSSTGRLASVRIERSMVEEVFGEVGNDIDWSGLTDGFINHARGVEGVEMAAQLIEAQRGEVPEDVTWRVSFRSRGRLSAARLAERFGGGGNHNAGGCTIRGEASFVERELASALDAMNEGSSDE